MAISGDGIAADGGHLQVLMDDNTYTLNIKSKGDND